MAEQTYTYAKSGRKACKVTARMQKGTGNLTVNGLPAEQYFGAPYLSDRLLEPLKLIQQEKAYDISCLAKGGGKSGQADACKQAIARCLALLGDDVRTTLKKSGYMKRDTRAKERKKYGLKRARKAPQFTKR